MTLFLELRKVVVLTNQTSKYLRKSISVCFLFISDQPFLWTDTFISLVQEKHMMYSTCLKGA